MSKADPSDSGSPIPTPLATTQKAEHKTQLSTFLDWELGSRYDLVKILGKGSYGKVAEAIDK